MLVDEFVGRSRGIHRFVRSLHIAAYGEGHLVTAGFGRLPRASDVTEVAWYTHRLTLGIESKVGKEGPWKKQSLSKAVHIEMLQAISVAARIFYCFLHRLELSIGTLYSIWFR